MSRVYYYDDPFGILYRDRSADKWVNPDRCRTKSEYPYSYDEFFVWGNHNVIADKNVKAVYSDRLYQWDKDKYDAAHAAVTKRIDMMNGKEANKFMSVYLDKKVTVVAIAEGCNKSSGYPYFIIWYTENA